jgi:hypothetical protein
MVTIPPKTPSIRIYTQNTLWGNKPMISQLSCHTIKSTTAQTFEHAENAEISQGWYVAALKIVTAHGRGVSCPSPLCTPERSEVHTASPHQTFGHGFLIAQPLFCFFLKPNF